MSGSGRGGACCPQGVGYVENSIPTLAPWQASWSVSVVAMAMVGGGEVMLVDDIVEWAGTVWSNPHAAGTENQEARQPGMSAPVDVAASPAFPNVMT